MYDYEESYTMESEIDKAFPYLDKLDEEINTLKNSITKKIKEKESSVKPQKEKSNFLNFFKKREIVEIKEPINKQPQNLKRKSMKSHTFKKDGYEFLIRLGCMYDENTNTPYYYEFNVHIKYYDVRRKNQFYKKIDNIDEAKQYYKDMEAVFKHLRRRDLMERLFKEKQQEIEYYKNQC